MRISVSSLSDSDLLASTKRAVAGETGATAVVVAHIAEVDARQLYRQEACSSMFVYCTDRLHLSEPATGKRIQVARLSRRYPIVLWYLETGRVHLTGLNILSTHLTDDNHRDVLDRATHLSKRKIEELCAELTPRPAVPEIVRKQHAPAYVVTSVESMPMFVQSHAPAHVPKPARVEPLATDLFAMQFTASRELKEKIDRAKALLCFHGDTALASVIDRAVTLLLTDLEKKRFGKTDRPRASKPGKTDSRRVPNAVKRAVYERDQGQCTYSDLSNWRCQERASLEYDHIIPFAHGGETTIDNLRLRCRSHNQLAAEAIFGQAFMAAKRDLHVT